MRGAIVRRAIAMKTSSLLVFCCVDLVGKASSQALPEPPTLNGPHFRFTVVQDDGWVDIDEDEDGNLEFSGFCTDIIRSVASSANFTLDLLPPSGFGSLCNHAEGGPPTEPYGKAYRSQYMCGQSDVQQNKSRDNYTTDFYQGLFYITPERLLLNKFTTPYIPPTQGSLQLFGTATGIRDVQDLIDQQEKGKQGPVCLKSNTAYAEWVQQNIPGLRTIDVDFETSSADDIHRLLSDGTCEILMDANPKATRSVLLLSQKDLCLSNGMPVGIIGDALSFGFSQFGIGVRQDLPNEVVATIDYWMNYLMTCSPYEDSCDSFAVRYPEVGGSGYECGYVAFPSTEDYRVSAGAIVGIVVGAVALVFLFALGGFYYYTILTRRTRVKKRFVQQLARNIRISRSPHDIPSEKLAALIDHISGGKDIVTEEDIRAWMTDINLPFLSDADLVFLWKSIDSKGQGFATAIELIMFFETCEREFSIVSEEVDRMSKMERLKFRARDLSILKEVGEEGARKNEFQMNRRARLNAGSTGTV